MKVLVSLFLATAFITFPINTVVASGIPVFPSCVAPQGELKVSYESGVHGIVGSSHVFEGSDRVYLVGQGDYMQCFCPLNGSEGIQTNWWNVSSLIRDDIEKLREEGWLYVANGSEWGLTSAPYLAKNTSFNCRGGVTTPAVTPTPTNVPNPTVTSTPASISTPTPTTAPAVGGSSSRPSVLAATGTSKLFAFSLFLGFVLMGAGIYLRKIGR